MMAPEVLADVLHRSESPFVLVTVPYTVPPGGVVGVGGVVGGGVVGGGVGVDGFVESSRKYWLDTHPDC